METSKRLSRPERTELDRIRRVYAGRSARHLDDRYSAYRSANLLWLHQRERVLLSALGAGGARALGDLEILDVGCGSGGELLRLVSHGADPARAHGVDLREAPVAIARGRLAAADLRVADAGALPYADGSMDLVLQGTMLSSVLDRSLQSRIAGEMSRVVRPDGLIASYDFRVNPVNGDVRGLSRRRLRELFPGHRIEYRSVTLAPPIARLVCPFSYGLATALQALPFLRTHVLAFIRPAGVTEAP